MAESDIPVAEDECFDITPEEIKSQTQSGQIFRIDYKFKVEFCLKNASGDKGYGIEVTFLPTSDDLLLYWPIPFQINIEIESQDQNTDDIIKIIPDDLSSPPADWSAYIGNEQTTEGNDKRKVGWDLVIKESRLTSSDFMSNGRITFLTRIFTEANGKSTFRQAENEMKGLLPEQFAYNPISYGEYALR